VGSTPRTSVIKEEKGGQISVAIGEDKIGKVSFSVEERVSNICMRIQGGASFTRRRTGGGL